jgi:hypothetical protein
VCIIIYTPDGFIPKKQLRRSLNQNPHGWGIMVTTGKNVWVVKGLTNRAFWEQWRNKPEGPTVFHARIKSHGEINLANCHPFPVPNHGQLHVAHNGIIKHHAFDKHELSDTRLFIRDVLSGLPRGFLRNEAITRLIEEYIGWSKLVFLDEKGNVTILNELLGHWNNNRWYSNGSYKPEKKKEVLAGTGGGLLWNTDTSDPSADGDEKAGEVVNGFFPTQKKDPPCNVPLRDPQWLRNLKFGYHAV